VPRIIVDSSKAEQQQGFEKYDGPMPPNGKYKALLKSAWWGMSKGSPGKEPVPMLTIAWEFRAKAEEKKRYDGFTLFQRITHQPSTLWRMQELFHALGQRPKSAINVTDKDSKLGKIVSHIGSAQVGRVEVLLTTKTEMYNGNERRGVDTLAPLPGTPDPEDSDEMDDVGEETSFDESQSMTSAMNTGAVGVDPGDEEHWDNDDTKTDPPF
jgi:hypothetical protein